MSAQKKIVIIAGPNGAGKTTFAREFLPREADCPLFINADLIAAGLSPFRPLEIYRQRMDYWQWFDNSGPVPRLLEEGSNR